MDNLLTFFYYFNPQPGSNFQMTKITLALALGLILLGFITEFYRKKKMTDKIARKILRPYPSKLMWYGLIAIFLLAVREAGIQYLSMRIWWFVLFAFMLFSGIKLLVTYKGQYAKRAKKLKLIKKDDKYLPRKKKA